ncbi:hypothetical protein VMCG_08993 [Cytospora schulzeri]|uniref:Amino acid permease/ SLC12A domain-containing protein n=1 Tax=Cytospora schulzeri TaxID=448051 RepID=A0A423VPX1_9PEZI|nr:hypothetical protein VMCG_08993 [Valsa malicola]
MASNKPDNIVGIGTVVSDVGNNYNEKEGTADDRADMFRLGKVQELRRNFRFLSMFGFSMILVASWETTLMVAAVGLTWALVQNYRAPTTGGQYHWISEFAPRRFQKFISYLMGWLCVLGWQTGCAATAYFAGTQIQALLVLNHPSYVYEQWHGTLLMIAVAAFGVLFNTLLARKLPLIEGIILVVHICAFIGIIVTLWVLAPLSGPNVFTQFSDGGWHSLGGGSLAGITAGIAPLLGADAPVHMSEELRDAGKTLPRSMIWSTVVNGALGWVMVITLCFCLGNMDEILASPTGYPYIQIFFNTTQSANGTTAMASILILMSIASNLTMIATASRQLYAFARDQAVPFSPWLSKVTGDLPINSIFVTFITSSLLSLINIGSSSTLNSIVSLSTSALMSSYICSIGCVTWRRLTGNPLPKTQFSLRKWALPINVISEAFLIVMFALAFFPLSPDPDAASMNWSSLIYGAVILFSMIYYIFQGRHRYVGPVEYVRTVD